MITFEANCRKGVLRCFACVCTFVLSFVSLCHLVNNQELIKINRERSNRDNSTKTDSSNLTAGNISSTVSNNTSTSNNNTSTSTNTTSTSNNTTSISTNTTSTSNNTHTPNTTVPFLLTFRVKSMWPIDKEQVERELTSSFDRAAVNPKYATAYITTVICLVNCPRQKRSLDANLSKTNNDTSTNDTNKIPTSSIFVDSNNTVYFNATFGSNSTNDATETVIKYDYNPAQGSILEASTAQIEFTIFHGSEGDRRMLDASTVKKIFGLYASYQMLNDQLKSVEEVIDFPTPVAEFQLDTKPNPLPSPSSSLLIPPWAIFLIVFLSLLILLFIIWLIYSCVTGTLKHGGAATLMKNDKEENDGPTIVGPPSHPYNISIHRQKNNSPPPTLVTGSACTIVFDRSTSYDVGLLTTNDVSPYKRRESRAQDGPIKKKINQRKQTNQDKSTNGFQTYQPKFTRLNSHEKLSSPTYSGLPPPLIRHTPPSPTQSERLKKNTNGDVDHSNKNNKRGYISKDSFDEVDLISKKTTKRMQQESVQPSTDEEDHIHNFTHKRNKMAGNDRLSKTGNTTRKSGYRVEKDGGIMMDDIEMNSFDTEADSFNHFYFQPPDSSYPIFQPLQTTYPSFPNYPYFISYPTPAYPASLSINSTTPPRSIHEEQARAEKIRKMARDLVEDAFDDSGFSTDKVATLDHKTGPDKPTDIEEFRKLLNEAFAFSKPKSVAGT